MTSSIYHLFKFLVDNKHKLATISNIEELEFNHDFISSRSRGVFPDLVIKINTNDDMFEGGELVEFKDSKSYNIASFNSTIPTGRKAISDIVNINPSIRDQMNKAGNKIDSLPYRDVYYLISGRKENNIKVVLVHGSFFETIPVRDLISHAFANILKDVNLEDDDIEKLAELFSDQRLFSQVRHIVQASVKIRFRIMTEVESSANLLNPKMYPEITDNSLNLCIPYVNTIERETISNRFNAVFDDSFAVTELTHKVNNGKFILFRTTL